MPIDPTQQMPAPLPAPANDAPTSPAPDIQSDAGDQSVPSVAPSTAPPIPAGSQINTDPNAVPGSVEPHHGVLASIFQDLAGVKKTSYRQTGNGPIAVKENLQPGDMARGILAAALTGLAAGYGTGGGAGKSVSAGFNAETQQQEQNQASTQKQAQQQFENHQAADELTLRRMQDARAQQNSIQQAQEHAIRMQQMQQDLEQGKIQGAQALTEFHDRQADRMNLLLQTGAKPLNYPDGTPVEEFNSPEEAMQWANKNAELAIHPGKYDTRVAVDPHTNRYVIMQNPKNFDSPQWLGVTTDKNGNPIRDDNGNFIPDGSFKDSSGKAVAPAGQLTPRQLYESQDRLIDMQTKKLSLEEAVDRLKTAREARAKDEQQMAADDQWNKAGGNPDAIDPKTNQFIVSPSSRTILQQRFIKDGAMQASILTAAQRELDKIDSSDPNFADLKEQADEARNNLHQIQVNMMLLGRTPNIADVLANSLKQENTGANGSVDTDAVMKALDSMNVNSGLKQAIRQKLTPQNRLDDPEMFAKATAVTHGLLKSGKTTEQVLAEINNTKEITQADRDRLTADLMEQVKLQKKNEPFADHPVVVDVPAAIDNWKQKHPLDQSGGPSSGAMTGMSR